MTYANDSAAAQTARETNEVEKGGGRGGGGRPKCPTFLVVPRIKNIRGIVEFQSPQIACRRHFHGEVES